ncbi:hypothetical protein [Actomonas aquatica]|uniref:Uncharacterized protein n=1 Tax=Actomonas aquatica TaxID=2866162 RepID=A0ABZ1C6L1_9BACT|nr:hypothetical protein [Opitutus sp. WL0086]WRQ87033.1 hypothetical protein K1X11_019640 [Opitutus sp. WL0086]
MPDSPDPLDDLFDAYPSPPPLAADFKAQVQQRLAQLPVANADAPSLPWWRRLERAFAQPAAAALFVCCCILVGLLAAEMHANAERARTHARVVNSYIELINPRVDPAPVATPPEARP